MSQIPANAQGLAQYKRTMITRFPGTCDWCGIDTRPGMDFFSYGHDGAKVSSCASCAVSVSAMILGVCKRVGNLQDSLTAEQIATLSTPDTLLDAIDGKLTPAETLVVLAEMVTLAKAVSVLTRVEDARIVALRNITPKAGFESSFIPSVLAQYASTGKLSDKQWACVDKALLARAEAAPAADGTPAPRQGRPNRFPGKCVNCAFQVPAGKGVYGNGVVSHTVCPTFEEWCMDTYGALPGSEALRQIAVNHGTTTAHCIFCGLTLEHPDSDPAKGGVGYGPVCAVKYGLPHGGSTKGRKG